MAWSGSFTLFSNGICLIGSILIGVGVYVENDAVAARRTTPPALATAKGCVACHDLNARKLGPSFKAIAQRYSTKDKAKLVDRVLKGSTGSWGSTPMPATMGMGVTPADADSLVTWTLNQK